MTLKELAAKLDAANIPNARVWYAADAKVPHIRVYFGDAYVQVTDGGDEWSVAYVGKGSARKSERVDLVLAAI